jgi:hypothetical protein
VPSAARTPSSVSLIDFAELDTRQTEEADITLRTTRNLAAVVQADRIGVARDLLELPIKCAKFSKNLSGHIFQFSGVLYFKNKSRDDFLNIFALMADQYQPPKGALFKSKTL